MDAVILRILIPWLATGAGCVAIWPVTVPKLEQCRKEVEMQALPKEILSIWEKMPKRTWKRSVSSIRGPQCLI